MRHDASREIWSYQPSDHLTHTQRPSHVSEFTINKYVKLHFLIAPTPNLFIFTCGAHALCLLLLTVVGLEVVNHVIQKAA